MTITSAEVLAADDARYAAMIDQDLEKLSALLSDSLIYTHSSGRSDSRAALLDALRTGRLVYRQAKRHSQEAILFGDGALLRGEATIHVDVNGTPKVNQLCFVTAWVKESETLRLIHWQSTLLPAAAVPPPKHPA